MAASIVYEGVESQGGGRLFQGLKFWVAQRVPSRKMFLDMIQQNGGSVVPLEKNADMLFADHMRKDAPPGAYSWKWIEDSIKQGALQSKDSAIYLIGRSAQEPRTVASAEPTRGTRTPFTPADDSALIKWVLSQSDKEKGNKIYQDFEQINGRHTFQSWRDRWVKKLSFLSQEDLQKRIIDSPPAPQPEEHDQSTEQQSEKSPVPQPAMEDPQATNQLAELASHWPRGQWWHTDHPPQQPVHPRTAYCMLRITRYVLVAGDRLQDIWKEDGILLRLVRATEERLLTRDVAEAGLKEIKASYRSQIEPSNKPPVEASEAPPSSVDPPPAPTAAQPRSRPQPVNSPTPRPTRSTAQPSPQRIRYTPDQDRHLAQSVEQAAQQGIQAGPKWFQEFAIDNPEHTWRSWRDHWLKVLRPRIETAESNGQEYDFHHPYSNLPSGVRGTQSRAPGSSADQRRNALHAPSSPEAAEEVVAVEVDQIENLSVEQANRRDQFFADMAEYREFMQLNIDLQPKIFRQAVDLFLLYEAAKAFCNPDGEVDWVQVAEKLSFGRQLYPNAPQLLRKCYDNSLKDFVSTWEGDDDVHTEQAETIAAIDDSETGQDMDDAEIVHEGIDDAPGLPHGLKRNRTAGGGPGWSVNSKSAPKRQRRSREDEIPSTPENILGLVSEAAEPNLSPSLAVRTARAGPPHLQEEVYDSQDSADFEITPSQQLHLEEQLTTPIPIQLPSRDSGGKETRASRPDKTTAGWDFTMGATNARENSIQQWSVDVTEAHHQSDEEQPQSTTDQDAEEVAKKVEYYESFGYSRKIVCQALTATCMETGIASEVMEMLRNHPNQGLPNNMTGVWTSKDDEGLKFTCGEPSLDPTIERDRVKSVARERKRLEYKHGSDRITTRIDFLAITRLEAKRKRMKTLSVP